MKSHQNDFDLRQLEIFCLIVEYKSFSRAAQKLYLTQPTVSEHMANLESALNLRLLDRKGKKISVTSAGKLFYAHALKILKLKKALMKEMSEFSSDAKGNILIGASTIPGSYVLPRLITGFKKLYPETVVTLKVLDTEEVIQAVKEGDYEIGVVGAKPKFSEIQASVLCKDQLQLILSPDHPLAKSKRPVTLQRLSPVQFIMREKGSAQREMVEKAFSKRKIPLNVICEMSGNQAIKEAVKSGDGAAILSYRAVEQEVKDGSLKVMTVRGLKFERSFYLIFHKHRTQSPLTQRFLTFIRKEIKP